MVGFSKKEIPTTESNATVALTALGANNGDRTRPAGQNPAQ